MFRKIKSVESNIRTPVLAEDNTSLQGNKLGNTEIASGVRLEGNINVSGQIDVYGTIIGNIDSEEGSVKIMCGGVVEGNIQGREIIVDGSVKGHCHAGSIDIGENGHIDGTVTYADLSIKKGGVLIGRAEQGGQPKVVANVVGLKHGVVPTSSEGDKSGRVKKNADSKRAIGCQDEM